MKFWFVHCLIVLLLGLGFSDNGASGCSNSTNENNEKTETELKYKIADKQYTENGLVIMEDAQLTEAMVKNIEKHDSVVIRLDDKTKYNAIIERHNIDVNNTITIRAKFIDYPDGYMSISLNNGYVLGVINIPGKNIMYRIKTDTETNFIYFEKPEDSHYIEKDSVLIPPERP